MILLDTNSLVYYLNGLEPVVARFQSTARRDLAIPSIVAFELEYGTLRAPSLRRRVAADALLATLHQVPFDHAAALEAARIRVKLEDRGLIIGPMDVLIAGTALSRGAILVTSNTREFSRVRGLRLEDWTKPRAGTV